MFKKIDLKNKTALVTGAGKGIGKACAIALAEAGANLIILSRTKSDLNKVEKQITKLKRKCKSYICDVSNYDEVKNVFNRISTLDILVNNAGIGTLPDFEEEDEKGWETMLSVNSKSIWLGIKSVLPSMKEQKSGSIVNVSSIFGASGGFGKSASYHASKGAVSALTRNAAVRYAANNIRINTVSPGFIKVLREEKDIENAGDKMSREIIFRTPMGRWGNASEVASAIHFLAGPESSYITGAELFVDGGWMAA